MADRLIQQDFSSVGFSYSSFSKDMLIGLFLGFWNQVNMTDTRVGYKGNKSIEELVTLHVSLDSSSMGTADNINYWANDPRFFGVIAQQDYLSVETAIELLGNTTFPFFAPCLGLDMNNPDSFRFVL